MTAKHKHSPLRVEVHCWKDGVPQFPVSPYDITRFVIACTWTNSLHPPWHDIQIKLSIPFRYIRNVLPGRPVKYGAWTPSGNEVGAEKYSDESLGYVPEPGFWVVVYQTPPGLPEKAVAVGRVHDISFGLSTAGGSGGVITTPVTLQAESILSFMGRSHLQLSGDANTQQATSKEEAAQPAGTNTEARKGTWGREGFVYDLQSWADVTTTLMQSSLANGLLGEYFSKMWQELVRIQLPPSLGGGDIGQAVPIVFSETTAGTSAPMRAGQMPAVPGSQAVQAPDVYKPRGQSLLQYFFSLFGADPLCTEIFSSLEYSPTSTTSIGKALGAQPVIVYRLRPWFVAAPSDEANQAYSESSYKGAIAAQSHIKRAGWAQTSAGQLGPRTGEDWYWWSRKDVESLNFGFSDGLRVNLAYGAVRNTGDVEGMTYGVVSQPIVPSNSTVDRHGLRIYAMNWPFLGIRRDSHIQANFVEQSQGSTTISDYNEAVSELAWIYGGDGQRWAQGSFSGRFRPWVMQGQWFVLSTQDSTLTGYIESVTHSVVVNQRTGMHNCQTSVNFSRGTLRHQDYPEWQYRLETAYTNAPGCPARLGESSGADGSDEGYEVQKARAKQTKALQAARAAAKAVGNPLVTPILYSQSGPMLAGVTSAAQGREIRFIVIHYTNSSSTSSMLTAFNKKRDGKYHTGTHYSVDSNGVVIEWADPSIYSCNNAPGFNSTGIGIDIIGTPSGVKNMSLKQIRALSSLIGDLRSRFPDISNKVADQRAPVYDGKKGYTGVGGVTPEPYSAKLALDNGWGILRHRDVTQTNCPGEVPVELAVGGSGLAGLGVQRVLLSKEQEAAIK